MAAVAGLTSASGGSNYSGRYTACRGQYAPGTKDGAARELERYPPRGAGRSELNKHRRNRLAAKRGIVKKNSLYLRHIMGSERVIDPLRAPAISMALQGEVVITGCEGSIPHPSIPPGWRGGRVVVPQLPYRIRMNIFTSYSRNIIIQRIGRWKSYIS